MNDSKPTSVLLRKNQYYFYCTCGKSASSPFCDGKHQGSDFMPLVFKVEQQQTAELCMCRQSSNLPFCDGSHSSIKQR